MVKVKSGEGRAEFPADILQAATVLPQVGVAETRGGTEVDNPPLPVKEEFAVIHEAEPGAEFNPQVALITLDKRRITAQRQNPLKSGKGAVRIAAETEWL